MATTTRRRRYRPQDDPIWQVTGRGISGELAQLIVLQAARSNTLQRLGPGEYRYQHRTPPAWLSRAIIRAIDEHLLATANPLPGTIEQLLVITEPGRVRQHDLLLKHEQKRARHASGPDSAAPEPGITPSPGKRHYLTGAARTALAQDLRKKYEQGADIATLVRDTGRSKGVVYQLLAEAGIQFRGRTATSHTKPESAARAVVSITPAKAAVASPNQSEPAITGPAPLTFSHPTDHAPARPDLSG